jgi:26S proteasome regulatory subunit N1
MAKDSEPPKSVDKGKGKAVDSEASKNKDVKKDKDGKPLVNGKAEEPVVGGMLELPWFVNNVLTMYQARISARKTSN